MTKDQKNSIHSESATDTAGAKPVAWRVDDSNPALCAIVDAAWEKHKNSRSTFFYMDFAEEVLNAAQPKLETSKPEQKLAVWYGPMPESNGKSNWTAILHKGDISEGRTIDRSEYPDRVRYEADCVRYLIGELDERPFILDYDADKHSGYVAPESVDDWRNAVRGAVSHLDYETDAPANVKAALRQLRDAMLAPADTVASPVVTDDVLEAIDLKAEAGLCYFTLESARAFLKDIRQIVAKEKATAHHKQSVSSEPVYYRYRHSEGEKWHYGPTYQNWWECQALGVIG